MIPASILTVVAAVVCKKVLDAVFDDDANTVYKVYKVIKDHDMNGMVKLQFCTIKMSMI